MSGQDFKGARILTDRRGSLTTYTVAFTHTLDLLTDREAQLAAACKDIAEPVVRIFGPGNFIVDREQATPIEIMMADYFTVSHFTWK